MYQTVRPDVFHEFFPSGLFSYLDFFPDRFYLCNFNCLILLILYICIFSEDFVELMRTG